MNYDQAVSRIWRHWDLTGLDDRTNLLRYAILAASSHNTQPWSFRVERSSIAILPDLSRRCPAVDPDDHHLYTSLGCAAENLLLAMQAGGLQGDPSYDTSTSGVQLAFEKARPCQSVLFEAIPSRQCSRSEYDGGTLSAEQLRKLAKVSCGSGTSVVLLTTDKQKEQVAECVVEGNRAQIGDPDWGAEMKAWIRFNTREAVRTGDGLYARSMGNPGVPRWLGKLVMRFAFSAERQNQKDVRDILSSGALAIFVSEANDRSHWVETGRCYERFALQATALDLKTAMINQPVEVPSLRSQFAAWLGIGDRRPDLVVRVGRGPEMPRSLRRPVEQVLK